MGKTWRRFDKDGDYRNVKKARQQQDEFHRVRQHTREIQEPEIMEDLGPLPPRKNTKLDAFKNIKGK